MSDTENQAQNPAQSENEKLAFIASILNATTPNDNGGGGVETSLDRFNNLVEIDYKEFANSVNLKEEVEAFTKLQSLQNELARLYSLRDIANKSVVAIGGGFSAGKSQFVSSFFKDNTIELPIGINPVTAISTYIINGDKHLIKGYTYKGGVVDIPVPLYKNLSHDFLKALGFNLKDILPMVAMETSIPDFTHICFVDTPGYNPAKTGITSKDSNTAKEALENANALLWLVGLDTNGTIPASDLDFLDSLDLYEKKLYIVANKADLKPESEIEKILDHFEEVLEERGLDYEGISAYNSRGKEEITYRHMQLSDFLHSVDKDIVSKDKLAKDLNEIFLMYKNTLLEQKSEKDSIKRLLHSLELDILESSLEGSTKITESIHKLKATTSTNAIDELLKRLESLKDSLLEALNEAFKDIFKSELDINSIKAQEFVNEANMHYDKAEYKEAKDLYEKAIKLGNAEAYCRLGNMYKDGKGVEEDSKKAIELYEKAIKLGSAESYYRLGDMYKEGEGVKQDLKKAIELYEKGCELDNADAYCNLAFLYYQGEGVEQDKEKAITLVTKASDLGSIEASMALGMLYNQGEDVEKDKEKSLEYFERAGRLGGANIYIEIGDEYCCGSDIEQDYQQAIRFYEKACELGSAEAYTKIAGMYRDSEGVEQDSKKAIEFYEKACELGSAEAYNGLGNMYHDGIGVEEDYEKAKIFYEKACSLGDKNAYYALGSMYMSGTGVEQDLEKAMELLEEAYNLKHWFAENKLMDIYTTLAGWYYEGENNMSQDFAKAKELYEKAYNLGEKEACAMLGTMYAMGQGVKQDLEKAVELLNEGYERGSVPSTYMLGAMYVDGMGVERDYEKARELLTKAADGLLEKGALEQYEACMELLEKIE